MRTDQTQALTRYVAVAVLLLIGGTARAESVGVPFADGYESGTLGPGWGSTGTAVVVVQNTEKIQGTYGCTVTNNLSLDINSAGKYTNVWVQIYAKPSPLAVAPALGTNVTAAFHVGSDRSLKAYSGSAWQTLMAAGSFPTGQWVGFAVHLDYYAKKWDLYYTNGVYGSPMVKVNPTALAFNATGKDKVLNGVSVSSQKPVHLDQIIAAKGSETVDDDSPDRLIVQTASVSTRTMLGLLGNRFQSPENTLAGPLGDYLMTIMSDGDYVTVRTNGTTYNFTYRDGPPPAPPYWDDPNGPTRPNPDTFVITPGMAVWLTKLSPGTIYGFGSYDANATPPNTTVNGSTTDNGWTQLAWPRDFDSNANGSGNWGFGTVVEAGDRVYARDPDTGIWHVLTWNSAQSKWMEGRNQSNFRMRPGLAFWYFKRTGSVKEWPAHTAQ